MFAQTQASKRVLVFGSEARALAKVKKGLMGRFCAKIATLGENAAASLCVNVAHDVHVAHSANVADALVLLLSEDGDWPLLEKLIEKANELDVPSIIMSKKDDESDEARAFAIGATDYAVMRESCDALIARLELRLREAGARNQESGFMEWTFGNRTPEFGRRNSESGILTPANAVSLSDKVILIAEDVELNRQIMEAMLSEEGGLQLDFANDGLEALERFICAPERYLALFLDIQMPKMDGYDAARAIRSLQNSAAKCVPIFALTATDAPDIRRQCKQAGMDGLLQKPVDYDEITAVLHACANESPQ